ncbi:hypothetical protein D9M72_345920 [compost metagenome]
MSPATPASPTAGRITVNSSPASRATVSDARTDAAMRRAASSSNRSPWSWPRVSFTSLKRSRSMNSSASTSCVPRERSISCRSRSKNRRRLGRSVSASKFAWCRMTSSAWRFSVMSWISATRRRSPYAWAR